MTLPHVLVCGSRSITDFDLVAGKLDLYCKDLGKIVVVTGACPKGADALAEKWASTRYHTVKRFHADWDLGKRAGPMRNEDMTAFVAGLDERFAVAFHDGTSRGTADCIERIRKHGIPLKVIRFR